MDRLASLERLSVQFIYYGKNKDINNKLCVNMNIYHGHTSME